MEEERCWRCGAELGQAALASSGITMSEVIPRPHQAIIKKLPIGVSHWLSKIPRPHRQPKSAYFSEEGIRSLKRDAAGRAGSLKSGKQEAIKLVTRGAKGREVIELDSKGDIRISIYPEQRLRSGD